MKIFVYMDCEYYAAENIDDAKKAIVEFHDNAENDIYLDDVEELPDASLDRLKFCDDLYSGDAKTRTFREELAGRIKNGVSFPCFFATSEY